MTVKTRIVEALGETALALPTQLEAALAANERAKYVLSLLQMAASHADAPEARGISLKEDRAACGIEDATLDHVIEHSRGDGIGGYLIPGLGKLISLLDEALERMLAPLEKAAAQSPAEREGFAKMRARFDALRAARPRFANDAIDAETIVAMTSGNPPEGDGIHRLIMDLHQEINRLLAACATETVAGAKAYGIAAADRPLIAAFMAGVARTAPLKFDHPGLAAVATRQGDTLLLQNDIGATEAHVLLIRIGGLHVEVIYSDVHGQRLRFFQSMLAETGLIWRDRPILRAPRLADAESFQVVHGIFAAPDADALVAFLDRLGSRLVFLIDWNKARKRLGRFVANELAIDVLSWAAAKDVGHRGFLQLGGETLIEETLARQARGRDEPLDRIVGANAAAAFLRRALEAATQGLLENRAASLIRDRLRADLQHELEQAPAPAG